MRYSYYDRLTARQKRTYRKSDDVTRIPLRVSAELRACVKAVEEELVTENRARVQKATQRFTDALLASLDVAPLEVKVLTRRPSKSWGELHGLYEPGEEGERCRITVWMRTAQRKDVVKFRTFFRTVLHEILHHLDYELLELDESFHTEGFYKRESSLMRQLAPPAQKTGAKRPPTSRASEPPRRAARRAGGPKKTRKRTPAKPESAGSGRDLGARGKSAETPPLRQGWLPLDEEGR